VVTAFAFAIGVFVAGLLVVVAALTGVIPPPKPKPARSEAEQITQIPLRAGLAIGGFFVVLLTTGWPVGATFAMIGGALLPTFATAKRRRRESIDRVEAIASWAESLRDTIVASAGMQQAIKTTAANPPHAIRREVKDLARRLEHQSLMQALRMFAADIRHPAADIVVASLLLATTRHAGNLQGVLRMTARAARDSAAMLRQIEAGRTRIYSQARLVGWVTAAMLVFLIVTQRDFLSPFDSFGGQLAMGVVGLAFLGSGIAIYHLGRPVEQRRVFDNVDHWEAERAMT
jgi:Flp pilus assembly protein TadB